MVWKENYLSIIHSFPVAPSLQSCFLLLRSHPTSSAVNIFTSSSFNFICLKSQGNCAEKLQLRELLPVWGLETIRNYFLSSILRELCHGKSFHLYVTPSAAASCEVSRHSPTAAFTVMSKVMALLEGGEVLIGKLRQCCTEALRINCCTEYAFSGLIGKWSGRCREGS